ncbi:ATP-binding protein [Candidatus Woesearchaeota archaeon]|nr:ATP-binding protein [Candidatus Woesearchaeota archaeon]
MKDLLFEWNPWWTEQYSFKGIARTKLSDVLPWIHRKEIVSIVGVRRAGKTTLLFEIISHLIKENKISPKNILFIKADDDRVTKNGIIDQALDEYHKWINPSSKIFMFIDEIQEITNWQKTLKRIYDLQPDLKIFISGSNASLLKEDLGSSLAGRFASFEVFPFSFSEYLRAKGIKIENNTLVKHKNTIRHLLLEYISTSAFPEVILEANEKMKKELITFYFDSIFYRDVIKRKEIRNPAKLEKLIKYFLQNISSPANFTKIAKLLDLTTDSVVEYTKALEDAYLIFQINLLEFSYKKQIINPKKIYCIDTGIRNIIGFKFSEDIGKLYENTVFIQLKRTIKEIHYWKNKYECDFITKEGKKLSAIQVCYDITNAKERELKGLLEAMQQFKLTTGHIITENYETEEKIEGKKIKYTPLWKWLITSDKK